MPHFFGIPIVVRPIFWIFAALIGFLISGSLIGTFIWIGIIFVSVLFHEMGHALTAILCKKKPRIELVAFGGVTHYEAQGLSHFKQFLIVFNGPLFGFFLFCIAQVLLQIPSMQVGNLGIFLRDFGYVNLFWTVLNLLPVFPLDGGQLLRIVLESIFGYKGLRYTQFVGMVLAGLVSLLSFIFGQLFLGALFFILAYQCFDIWRQSRLLSEEDSSDKLKQLLQTAESELLLGNLEKAKELFQSIIQKSQHGVIHAIATQHLGIIYAQLGQKKQAYELLLSVRKNLTPDTLLLLHKLAFDEKDYPLVIELAGECFQYSSDVETALRNAYACARLSQAKASVGWLSAAIRGGLQNIHDIIKEQVFDAIRTDEAFRDFIQSH